MWCVELVAQDVDGRNSLDVVFCAQVGGQEAAELNQSIVALQTQESSASSNEALYS